MKSFNFPLLLALGASLTLGSCSVFQADTDSKNPLIAEQAQRVSDLENQVNNQKRVAQIEKDKQKALEFQLKSAKQELKARKQQVKIGS